MIEGCATITVIAILACVTVLRRQTVSNHHEARMRGTQSEVASLREEVSKLTMQLNSLDARCASLDELARSAAKKASEAKDVVSKSQLAQAFNPRALGRNQNRQEPA